MSFPVATRAPAEASLPGPPSRLPVLRGPGLLGGETPLRVCPPNGPSLLPCLTWGYSLPLSLSVGSFSSPRNFPSPLPSLQVPEEPEAETQRPLRTEDISRA